MEGRIDRPGRVDIPPVPLVEFAQVDCPGGLN